MGEAVKLDSNFQQNVYNGHIMQVPVNPYYTISARLLLQNTGSIPEMAPAIRINILLNISKVQFPDLFLILGTIKNNFLISLPAGVVSDQQLLVSILPECYLLSSLDNFSLAAGNILPIIAEEALLPGNKNTDLIQNYFLEQGTRPWQFPNFSLQQTVPQQTANCSFNVFCPVSNNEDIETIFPDATIIAFAAGIADITAFNKYTALVKTYTSPDFFSTTFIEKKLHEEELQNWQQRALLYRSFLSLSKSVQQKEYYDVLDWYKKEYEALPLWYKRFGHIIKVLMGKRSFRSLFNDKFKKNTD